MAAGALDLLSSNQKRRSSRPGRGSIVPSVPAPAQQLLALQRSLGNQTFQRALRERRQPATASLQRHCACDDAVDYAAKCDDCRASGDAAGETFPALFERRTGHTSCDLVTGKATPAIDNPTCTRPCTEAHEATHTGDIASCCAEAGKAYRAAPDDASRGTVEKAWTQWMRVDNWAYLECRAYKAGLKCLDDLYEHLKCKVPEKKKDDCCKTIEGIWPAWAKARDNQCGKQGASSPKPCPFPLPAKQSAEPDDGGDLWDDLFGDLSWPDVVGDQVEGVLPGDQGVPLGDQGAPPGDQVEGEVSGAEPEDDPLGIESTF